MINNRQGGRRRGRGGQRSQGGNPGRGPDNGNRIDNRARGNAAQLLEKYKTLARDAQMQGDRVNTEYYLQFADHYFRVLAETRSRFEDNQPRRNDAFDADDGDDFDNEANAEEAAETAPDRSRGNGYRDPAAANGHGSEANGNRAFAEEDAGEAAAEQPARDAAPRSAEGRPRRGRPPRRVEAEAPAAASAEDEGVIDAVRLPPSLGAATADDGEGVETEAPAKPRRRRRAAAPEVTPVS